MHNYIRLTLPNCELDELDRLIGAAMLDSAICKRLVVERDTTLLEEFELSPVSRQLISRVEASTLAEFADALVILERQRRSPSIVTLRSSTIE